MTVDELWRYGYDVPVEKLEDLLQHAFDTGHTRGMCELVCCSECGQDCIEADELICLTCAGAK